MPDRVPDPDSCGSLALPRRLVLLWRSYLPYHVARLRAAQQAFAVAGCEVLGLQATADSAGYEFLTAGPEACGLHTALPGKRLADCTRDEVFAKTLAALRDLRPDVVFGPATPFPEGMAAIRYRNESAARVFLMDDSWEATDPRGRAVATIKRLIHQCADGAFVPAAWYGRYFAALGIPEERLTFPVDVVENDWFARPAAPADGAGRPVPSRRFLFVGRDLPRKGLGHLLAAYQQYRQTTRTPWDLEIVGPPRGASPPGDGVVFTGPLTGPSLRERYWAASVLVVPSDWEQWGLVVNEGMAASLPVIASSGVGAARSLVVEGSTGWTFPAGDRAALAQRLATASASSNAELIEMGRRARERVDALCSLEQFVAGMRRALNMPRRPDAAVVARVAARLWRGRLAVY
jgi:glycosyltransferase involved in cell wall biosynthesis